ERYGDRLEILSGIPKPKRGVANAKSDKINWMREKFSETVPLNIVLRTEKPQFVSGKGDILIDDYDKNIKEWEREGGTGVLFTDYESLIKKLDELEENEQK
ncbi:MAG: hypothetical protein K6F84_08165, partial [Lachnospiraceae bacterium]|nr:hypothetical protein [Lachnospiraceae bacterium]